MADERPEPDQPLAPNARAAWTAELAGTGLIAVAVAYGVSQFLGDQDGAWHTIGAWLPYVVLVGAVLVAAIVPTLRLRRWRWHLYDDELDLRHGALTEIRTIVPVARIQHVDVKRTLWSQFLGTATVVVHTAAGTTEIPVLREADATAIRDRLAGLIQTPDDE